MPSFTLQEVHSIYVHPQNRFVVSLIAGYAGAEDDDVTTPQEAAAAALALTRDEGSFDTYWCVYDRETQKQDIFTQRQFDSESP